MIPPSTPEEDFQRAIERQKQRLDSSEWVWKFWNWSVYAFFAFSVVAALLATFSVASSHFLLLVFIAIGFAGGIGLSFGIGHMMDSEKLRKPKTELNWTSISIWRFTLLSLYLAIAGLVLATNFDFLRTPTESPTHNTPSSQDPMFSTCRDAIAAGFGPYYSGFDVEYNWYIDRDSDGIVCER